MSRSTVAVAGGCVWSRRRQRRSSGSTTVRDTPPTRYSRCRPSCEAVRDPSIGQCTSVRGTAGVAVGDVEDEALGAVQLLRRVGGLAVERGPEGDDALEVAGQCEALEFRQIQLDQARAL